MREYLEDYGFSEDAIKALLNKGKYQTPYGLVKIVGNELITVRSATKEVKIEKIKKTG
jgi:hypothetical protein